MDWYRRKNWTTQDEEEFFSKLNRARKGSRAQYLKIQAIELIDTGNEGVLDVAERLLTKILEEYPDNLFEKACTLHSLGDIHRLRNDYMKAISCYKLAVEVEQQYPNVTTSAFLDYSELIVKTGQIDLFKDVERLLLDREPSLVFANQKYIAYSLLSIINSHNQKLNDARYYADLAEQFAQAETSGFRYHKTLGVVKERDEWLDIRLKQSRQL